MSEPFDDLDAGEAGTGGEAIPAAEATRRRRRANEPGAVTAFARGARRRCPRCGGGRLFETWFRIRSRCPRCGLLLEREEGGFLGAMTINYAATSVAWLALLIAWLVLDLPDVHVQRLMIASIATAGPRPAPVLAVLEDDLGVRRLPRVSRGSGVRVA